jgi:hypothetical protein
MAHDSRKASIPWTVPKYMTALVTVSPVATWGTLSIFAFYGVGLLASGGYTTRKGKWACDDSAWWAVGKGYWTTAKSFLGASQIAVMNVPFEPPW